MGRDSEAGLPGPRGPKSGPCVPVLPTQLPTRVTDLCSGISSSSSSSSSLWKQMKQKAGTSSGPQLRGQGGGSSRTGQGWPAAGSAASSVVWAGVPEPECSRVSSLLASGPRARLPATCAFALRLPVALMGGRARGSVRPRLLPDPRALRVQCWALRGGVWIPALRGTRCGTKVQQGARCPSAAHSAAACQRRDWEERLRCPDRLFICLSRRLLLPGQPARQERWFR